MMKSMSWILASAALVSVVGCSDFGPVVDHNRGGTGTTSLLVIADINAEQVAGGVVTEFMVEVRDNLGQPVSDATVTFRNGDLGEITVLEVEPGSGIYRAERTEFADGEFELTVISGEDRVENVVAGSPGMHVITAPLQGDTVTALEDFMITWDASAEARTVEVSTRDWESTTLPDTREALLPGENNLPRIEQRFRVRRFNEVDILGGLPDSRLRISVRAEVEPVLVQVVEAL